MALLKLRLSLVCLPMISCSEINNRANKILGNKILRILKSNGMLAFD